MAVRVDPIPDSVRLRITGDVETVLSVPYEDDDRFLVGFSDGTLIVGSFDESLQCSFEVARYGAGIVRLEAGAFAVEWRMEWATVGLFDPNVVEPPVPNPLPLFPDLDRWAA